MIKILKENRAIKLAIKLIIFVAIITYVISKVHWQDELVLSTNQSVVANETIENEIIEKQIIGGQIIGPWSNEVVQFRGDNGIDYDVAQNNTDVTLQVGFFTYLKSADIGWLLTGCFMFLIGLFFNALRWQKLVKVQGIDLSYWQALALNWIGLFFNNFLPGQTGGDVAKAYFIARRSPDKKAKAVMSVVVDRLIGLMALMMVGFAFLLLFNQAFQNMALKLWAWLVLALVVALLLMNKRFRQILRISQLIPKHPKVLQIWQKVYVALYNYGQNKSVLLFCVGLSITSHLITISGIYFFSKSIHMSLPITDFYGLVPMIFLLSSIPIAPSGWGVGEALFGHFFSHYASYDITSIVSKYAIHTQAVAISLLFRLQLTFWSLIGGIFYLQHKDEYQRSKKLNDE